MMPVRSDHSSICLNLASIVAAFPLNFMTVPSSVVGWKMPLTELSLLDSVSGSDMFWSEEERDAPALPRSNAYSACAPSGLTEPRTAVRRSGGRAIECNLRTLQDARSSNNIHDAGRRLWVARGRAYETAERQSRLGGAHAIGRFCAGEGQSRSGDR